MRTILIYAIISLLPLGQLGRISLGDSVNLYLHDIAVVALLLALIPTLLSKRHSLKLTPIGLAIMLFSVAAALSLSLAFFRESVRAVLIGSLYLWRWLAYAGVYIALSQIKLISEKTRNSIPNSLIAVGFLSAVVGLVQYILLPDTRFLLGFAWDEHYYRLIGSWLDPGFTGIMLVLTILLIVNAHWKRLTYHKKSAISYLLLAICSVALMLTYSRASYLSLLVGLTAISFLKRNVKIIAIGVSVIVFSAVLLPRPGGEGAKLERTQSIVNRIQNASQATQLIKAKPAFGVGFNLLRFEKRKLGILGSDWRRSHSGAGLDNSFLFVIATTGLLGLASYLWLLKSQLSFSFKHNPVMFASLLAVLAHSVFNNTLFYPWTMLWLWILLGSTTQKQSS